MTGRQRGRKPAGSAASLAFLGRTLDPIHAGVAILDHEARIVHVNEAARRLLPVIVDPTKDYFSHMAAVEVRNAQGQRVRRETSAVTRALQGEVVDDYAVTIAPAGGDEANLSATIVPVHGDEDDLIGVCIIFRDLTVQRKAEDERDGLLAQVQSQLAELDGVLDAMADSVIIYTANLDVVHMNRRAETTLGVNREAWNAMSLVERAEKIRLEDPRGRPIPMDQIPTARALRGEVVSDLELVLHAHDRARHFIVNAAPTRAASGAITGLVTIFTDVTSLVELRNTQDEFIRMVSHDLRHPLTVIQGHAQILDHKLQNLAVEGGPGRSTAAIVASAKRMGKMLGDLVDAGRLETGQMALAAEPTVIHGFLREMVENVRPADDREGGPTAVILEVADGLPPVLVDPERLHRVVLNLLDNALRYSPPGEPVTVAARLQGNVVVVAVTDRGPGIAAEDLPRVFQRYFRGRTGDGQSQGLGLGLYISRLIVETHGGRIWVDSTVGVGSTFSFTVPVYG